jgi:hypothetical protein
MTGAHIPGEPFVKTHPTLISSEQMIRQHAQALPIFIFL